MLITFNSQKKFHVMSVGMFMTHQ